MALPCIYELQSNFVHFFYFSSFYCSPFLMVVSTSLEIIYLFLYSEYINYIHLNFHLFPPPLMCDLLLA
jgi:hypothetical protein